MLDHESDRRVDHEVERKIVAILRILSTAHEPLGARVISKQLKDQDDIELTERAVRYHLKLLDERGLTQGQGKEGRLITPRGLEEVRNALVQDKVGLIISKIETLAYLTTFDPATRRGKVILNSALIPADRFRKALSLMRETFKAGLCVGDRVMVVPPGEALGELEVPAGYVGFGTVCSMTINGVLLKAGVPVDPRFGGLVQIEDGQPRRFVELVSYNGASMDPLELFIRARLSDVRGAAAQGNGKILAGFKEIPSLCLPMVDQIVAALDDAGLHSVIRLGRPSRELLDVPVAPHRVGLAVYGGLNPLAALVESGLVADVYSMHTMIEFQQLQSFWDL